MRPEWLEREAVVTVKAYPNPSAKYHETVCVAAITKEDGLIRLYPVQFRSLPVEKRFRKYQRIRLRMTKHKSDVRPESFRPDEHSIELFDVIGTENRWKKRWEWIEPTLSKSMCEVLALQKAGRKSLGVFRPKEVLDLVILEDSPEWSGKKQSALDQLTLFDERTTELEKIPFIFKYKYVCEDAGCKGHTQSVIDWEIMGLYRNVRRLTKDTEEIKAKIRQKYFDQLCAVNRDTHFFVGNHSLHPRAFMVLGVYWPPKGPGKVPGDQKTLFQ